jgi:hypothetical protein
MHDVTRNAMVSVFLRMLEVRTFMFAHLAVKLD